MTTVLASAADRRYGWWLLNMLGSVHARSPGTFDAIVVYDLGLSRFQRRLAARIRGVELRPVPPFVPHWREGFTWKPWILRHVEGDAVVYLDAGVTVLRPLDGILAGIRERGYWVVSQGHPIGPSTPPDYWERFGVDPARAQVVTVAAGIIGFARPSRFFDDVIVRTYEDCLAGLSLGFSPGEVERLNTGLTRVEQPVLRECPLFRWDQTVLNLRLRAAYEEPVVAEMARWAGREPDADAEQAIWAHRRSGDFRFVARVPYRMPVALVGVPFGVAWRVRWWFRLHRWLFRPSTYTGKLRRLVAARRD